MITRVYEEEEFNPNDSKSYIFKAIENNGYLEYELTGDPEEDLYVLKQYCDENGLELNVIIND